METYSGEIDQIKIEEAKSDILEEAPQFKDDSEVKILV